MAFVKGIHRSAVDPPATASDAELWCFFELRLNKRLSKQQSSVPYIYITGKITDYLESTMDMRVDNLIC